MKRIIALCFCIILIFTASACGEPVGDAGKISIVTTIFPVYDWIRNVAAGVDGVEIKMLIDSGVDLHSFQPTTKDILEISTCDMFVYVGGESDEWVDDALGESTNKKLSAINLIDTLGESKLEEELKEGMQGEEKEEIGEDEEEETEYDEHIWLSLKNAKIICRAVCDALCKVDPENSAAYKSNTDEYIGKLDELDKEYEEAVNAGSKKTLLFGDRFPFRYMTEDYGIDYYAAFLGCSAESEASFKTIVFLANKVDELNLDYIIKIEGSDGKLANTVKQNTKKKGVEVLTLNSMQSVTENQVDGGADYLKICKENLEVLRKALK